MSLPQLLANALGDESVVAEVSLGGEDVLVVTPTRTVVYRAEGLLSDESTTSYPHDVERLSLSVGRRKAKFTLEYGLEGSETLSVPAGRVDAVIHPMLAGIMSATGVTEAGEAVRKTFRFSDLTLVITSKRVVKHIGAAVWSMEYEAFEYGDLTNLDFEEGSVATTIVLTHDGRQERLKAPSDEARAVRESLVEAVCAYHDVGSLEELRSQFDDGSDEAVEGVDRFDFGDGPDPLSTESAADDEAATVATEPIEPTATTEAPDGSDGADAGTTDETDVDTVGSGPTESSGDAGSTRSARTGTTEATATDGTTDDTGRATGSTSQSADGDAVGEEAVLAERLEELTAAVERQESELARQAELIETLIEELRRGR
jgi:hypothetical protein